MITKRMSITMTTLVVALLSVLCLFLLQTGNVTKADLSVDFTGTWRIILINNEIANDNAMLVFNNQQMTYYPGGGAASITSDYSLKEDKLLLDDLKMSFVIQRITDNAVKMEGSDGRAWQTLKISDAPEMKTADQINLEGGWNVLLHGNSPVSETMTVSGDQLTFYKAGSDVPYFTGNFTWESVNHLYIASMNLRMVFYPVNESTCTMVEGDRGYCWEIIRQP